MRNVLFSGPILTRKVRFAYWQYYLLCKKGWGGTTLIRNTLQVFDSLGGSGTAAPGVAKQISNKNIAYDVTLDIRQPEVTPAVAECQFIMLKTEQVEYGGVHIVHMHFIELGLVPEIVGCAIGEAWFDSTSRKPHGESAWIMIPTSAIFFCVRCSTKF